MPEPDCFLRYHFSAATRNFTSGKSDVYVGVLATAARCAFNMVLFTEPVSRRNTFVGGKCVVEVVKFNFFLFISYNEIQIFIVLICFKNHSECTVV